MRTHSYVMVVVVAALALMATATAEANSVVNMDWNTSSVTDPTHVGDDGVLSTPGGMIWNGLPASVDGLVFPIADEFGNPTPVRVEHFSAIGGYPETVQPTDLQIGGFDGEWIEIDGLLPGEQYDVAMYLGYNSGFQFTDSTGSQIVGLFGNVLTGLPGVVNTDYVLLQGVMGVPYDNNQKFGFILSGFDGQILGMQIKGVVPEPASLTLLGLGGLTVLRRRRKV